MKLIRPFEVTPAALLYSNVPETEYAAWNSGTTYAVGARVQVTTGGFHEIYESAQGSNLNHNPTTDLAETWWLDVSATNPWRMFDTSTSTQTSNPESIEVEIQTEGIVDSLAFISLVGVRLTINQLVDSAVVKTVEFSLIDNSAVINGYTWAFDPIVRITDKAFTDWLPFPDSIFEVVLEEPGATAFCGACVPGQKRDLGGTRWGASVGITDYSIKEKDEWGTDYVLERAYSKRGNFQVWIPTSTVSYLQNLLASFRAIPIVYIGDDDVGATILFGFYKEFEEEIAYHDMSLMTLEIESLT